MADDMKPMPDPTVLTTEQLLREITNAVTLLTATIDGLRNVIEERFKAVDTQFQLVERQRVEQKVDTATAVQAALAAAKEAVTEQTAASEKSITKSETATAEQLRQLTQTFTTAIGGVTDSLSDLKARVGNIEARKEGSTETRAVVMAVMAILVVIVVAALTTHGFTK